MQKPDKYNYCYYLQEYLYSYYKKQATLLRLPQHPAYKQYTEKNHGQIF